MTIKTKKISSTEAQNNFGQVMDAVSSQRTRFIIQRRGIPNAVILSFEDFEMLLANETERNQMCLLLKEVKPEYQIGQAVHAEEIEFEQLRREEH
jgi:prevent-host-death family protein